MCSKPFIQLVDQKNPIISDARLYHGTYTYQNALYSQSVAQCRFLFLTSKEKIEKINGTHTNGNLIFEMAEQALQQGHKDLAAQLTKESNRILQRPTVSETNQKIFHKYDADWAFNEQVGCYVQRTEDYYASTSDIGIFVDCLINIDVDSDKPCSEAMAENLGHFFVKLYSDEMAVTHFNLNASECTKVLQNIQNNMAQCDWYP